MKLNWGWKIALVYIGFVVLILSFVFRARSEKIDLVAKDYYEQELVFKDKMEASANANEVSEQIEVSVENGLIQIQLPKQYSTQIKEANVHFYCPSDASNDVKLNLNPDEHAHQIIPTNALNAGNYYAKIQWVADGKNYYIERKVRIE